MAAAAAASTERSALDALMAFNDECSRHDLTQVNTELKEFAAEVLDALYAEFVLKVGREADGRAVTPMQYAEDRLGVGGGVDIPLSGIQGNYTTRLGDMLRFQEVLRLPSFGMIPPEYTQKKVPNHMQDSAKHRMDKIVDGLFSMYSVVFHTRKLSEGRSVSHPVPLCEMYAKHPNIEIGEPDEAHTDQHKLILYALHRLAEMRARRFDEWVMVPKTTSTGYNSTAYERKMRIDQFLAEECTKERNYPMWLVLTSGERVGNWTTRILREHKNLEFPDLVRSRTKFAFNDGVYLADEDVFRPYGDADRRKLTVPHLQSMTVEQREQLNQIHEDQESASRYMQWSFGTASDSDTPAAQSRRPTIAQQLHAQRRNILLGEEMIGEAAAAVYHDMDFNPGVYETAMDVPTPNCDKIWETQELPDEVKRWVYALIGRMLYNVGELDDWQISPFFKVRRPRPPPPAARRTTTAPWCKPLTTAAPAGGRRDRQVDDPPADPDVLRVAGRRGDVEQHRGQVRARRAVRQADRDLLRAPARLWAQPGRAAVAHVGRADGDRAEVQDGAHRRRVAGAVRGGRQHDGGLGRRLRRDGPAVGGDRVQERRAQGRPQPDGQP